MLSRILRTTLAQPVTRFGFASANKGGNLYTWGTRSAGLGYPIASGSEVLENPKKIEEFNNNVAKVSMGPTHTAVVTTDGDLYTFGAGDYGALGHGDGSRSRYSPKIVEYFTENGLRVKDVVVGKHHTLALTDNGALYSWGYGGKSLNPLSNWFNPRFGALGLGSSSHRDTPSLIEDSPIGSVKSLYSGYNFAGVLNGNGDVFNWGTGHRGVFADESNKHLKSPVINDALHHMKEDGKVLKKIKACGDSVLALFEDGSLYGWGDNRLGQLGIKKDVGIELYEFIFHPERLVETSLHGKKIVDFDLGEEISVILTDSNEVFWFGLKLALEPHKLDFPTDKKIKRVSVANPWIVAVTEDNQVYSNDRILGNSEENYNTGLFKANPEAFNGGEVVEIGGQYTNRYAIVRS